MAKKRKVKSRRIVPCSLCTRSCGAKRSRATMLVGRPTRWRPRPDATREDGYFERLTCLMPGCERRGRRYSTPRAVATYFDKPHKGMVPFAVVETRRRRG